MTITFELNPLAWRFWCRNLYAFKVKEFDGNISFDFMTLNFQGYELCKITFEPFLYYNYAKHCQMLTQGIMGKGL